MKNYEKGLTKLFVGVQSKSNTAFSCFMNIGWLDNAIRFQYLILACLRSVRICYRIKGVLYMRKMLTGIKFFSQLASDLWGDFLKAKRRRTSQQFMKSLSKGLIIRLQDLRRSLHKELIRGYGIYREDYKKLQGLVSGLSNYPFSNRKFSVSVLVPVYHPDLKFFKEALVSVLNQTIEDFEILIGFDGDHDEYYFNLLEILANSHPNGEKLRHFIFSHEDGGGISRTTNKLAEKATGDFLLLMDHDDWIRPDLLYRYRQAQFFKSYIKGRTVLYCDEFRIDQHGQTIDHSLLKKPQRPIFPYIFVNWICHALLVPKALWQEVDGLRPEKDGAQDYDLCLRLDLWGANFLGVPAPLYAWRAHSLSTAMSVNSKPNATVAGLESLKEYVEAKNFSWKCVQGNKPTTFRAIPRRSDTPKVQVIIPYKDQRDLTVKSVESLLGQTGAILHITCVDNNSNDPKIARFLEDMDTKITVLKYTEPFNYSRINNYAVRKGGDGEPYLFFMNNDVKLRPGALQEMLRWIDQPHIGIVSCRLFYPDKKIQHGGIMLWTEGPEFRCIWKHVDYELMKDQATFSDNLMIVDAVTAACALMRRKDFDGIGGFDECHYPVAFSDTDLCMRLRHKGLYPFFTPFAEGIHYEGASRDNDNLEDLESSLFFNRELRFDIDLRRLVPYYSMGNF